MNKKSNWIGRMWFSLFLFCLVGCFIQQPQNNAIPATNVLTERTIVATRPDNSQTPTNAGTPSLTATPALTFTPVAAALPTATAPSTPGVAILEECPTISSAVSPRWPNGSVFFSIGQMIRDNPSAYLLIEQPGIWAISSGSFDRQLVTEGLSNGILSPDGTKLVDVHFNLNNTGQEAVFYDLVSGQSQRFEFASEQGLFPSVKWLSDGRVQYTTNLGQILGVGETREGIIIDPVMQQITPFVQQLELPDYDFDPAEVVYQGFPSGFAAIDPKGELVLYTAGQESDNFHEVRLLNLQTGEVIWQTTSNTFGSREPEWSLDGEHALFVTYQPTEGTPYGWTKLVSVSRDGVEEELPPQPFPQSGKKHITSWTRAPDGRYIFYSVQEPQNLRGFILDTTTRTIGEVCDPETIDFVRDERSIVKGQWVANDYFVYRVLVDREGQPTHSLRVLDIANWTTQVVFEPEPGQGVNLLGWAPVETFQSH
ncbi:MAG: hypothetical protein IPF56_02290 [Chloroflexi bacterium]|nr:hypothetical protein [Chloroflexota bacterium]MBK6711465.1 hypothetical protein [Chloroflexota bacterium]MBK7176675.1 hypothetical protein [Chloroflexota bacterium]MBK7915655.1 hypothetical protein [Chloroflexota bacterium]MBK8935038.1 hypothetical protein [Chloroflexota bacterium]